MALNKTPLALAIALALPQVSVLAADEADATLPTVTLNGARDVGYKPSSASSGTKIDAPLRSRFSASQECNYWPTLDVRRIGSGRQRLSGVAICLLRQRRTQLFMKSA
jgi:hypothetical protein